MAQSMVRSQLIPILMFAAAFFRSSLALAEEADKSDKQAVQEELDGLQGEWKVATAELNGRDVTDRYSKSGFTLTIQHDVWVNKDNDGQWGDAGNSIIKLDPSKSPKEFDHVVTVFSDGVPITVVTRCIYELAGDSLKICYRDDQKDRPKQFSSQFPHFHLVTFKRAAESK